MLPTLPATRNGITFTAAGDGMVHAKGTATDWATILVTQDLPAGEYTLEHTLADGVGPFCELKSTDGRIDLFSHGTVKATLPAGDYQMLVSVSPGKTVDATISSRVRGSGWRVRPHHPAAQDMAGRFGRAGDRIVFARAAGTPALRFAALAAFRKNTAARRAVLRNSMDGWTNSAATRSKTRSSA